jgi:hypothetical protein
MDYLNHYQTAKQDAFLSHRPCYQVPQYMSETQKMKMNNARNDLQKAYNKEMAKPISQRDTNLVYEMDCQLNPRLCGW